MSSIWTQKSPRKTAELSVWWIKCETFGQAADWLDRGAEGHLAGASRALLEIQFSGETNIVQI